MEVLITGGKGGDGAVFALEMIEVSRYLNTSFLQDTEEVLLLLLSEYNFRWNSSRRS